MFEPGVDVNKLVVVGFLDTGVENANENGLFMFIHNCSSFVVVVDHSLFSLSLSF